MLRTTVRDRAARSQSNPCRLSQILAARVGARVIAAAALRVAPISKRRPAIRLINPFRQTDAENCAPEATNQLTVAPRENRTSHLRIAHQKPQGLGCERVVRRPAAIPSAPRTTSIYRTRVLSSLARYPTVQLICNAHELNPCRTSHALPSRVTQTRVLDISWVF